MFQIIWTDNAIQQQTDILEFWIRHNNSETYSRKILAEIKLHETLLLTNPFLGAKTHYRNVRRVIVLDNFSLFYTVYKKDVQIISVWDNRRNPEDFNI